MLRDRTLVGNYFCTNPCFIAMVSDSTFDFTQELLTPFHCRNVDLH